ncbi:heterodimeric geranylgeranyl pyrophosphate synthase small subunit, chloroplastic [Eucalyptus grandis]|uniref:heterodimeric geranylgeranyl pyrophosphate synthase small subunit, chloroplastic n=1 Tax=Eucalyptus grandis TaxID=71139 RepID=UPI00192EBD08|nr:heterodimeric geranylgeranyl pyrophosphate synthase small subunit, chloroplastic [Eucalyptus grandis]XP_039161451.1 heterodimeric geranylgeranyl pyrophosphate synthase small subunit, chloroplastic [Eucalyptus grandis]XP_039161452.1 heterodimeric geranylgeranyl pyrophosphate synthase small subunit, chloroplastic [Eucalyptus grandis]
MDDDPSRRGQPSSHTVYSVDMAILAGDALFPLGFRHIVSQTPSDLVPEPCLLRVIVEIARSVGFTGMAAGQFLDLEGGPNSVDFVQENIYGEMAECSALCGGLLGGAKDEEIRRLRRYGRAVGVLYQVVEDRALLNLSEEYKAMTNGMEVMFNLLTTNDYTWTNSPEMLSVLKPPLMQLCARYLLQEKKRGKALDSVANFHLQNGAMVERINWMADRSEKGQHQSAGIMVNYVYRTTSRRDNNGDE